MVPGVATKVIAATCALSAFSVGIVAGLLADNPADVILLRALVALVIGQAIGLIVGAIGERTVRESVAAYTSNNPIPDGKPGAPSTPLTAGASTGSIPLTPSPG